MPFKYKLHEDAQNDLENSLEWYMQRSVRAAENFIAAMDTALALICEHPERWRNTHKNYHELGLKKYPFTIIYAIEKSEQIVVVSSN
ncbi:hypothetical protein BH11BAC3_BH11BAC3_21920 [soil metagenome]